MPAPVAIASPCVKTCVIDDESGLCLGCLRTLDEIGGWGALSEQVRAALMAELPGRRGAIAPHKLGPHKPTPG